MQKLILHIPHSAIEIPIMEGFVLSQKLIQEEILKITDWHTDDLFSTINCIPIIFNYSRIFCDPERFTEDENEPMSKVGMGVLYDKTDEGNIMREITPKLRAEILENYYYPHHKKLNDTVKEQLSLYDKAIIIDCHSFPETPLKRSTNKTMPRPDFNIGTDKFHTPQKLIDVSIEYFKSRGYSLGIDYPYNGSIVPSDYYGKEKKVHSIMLEINRKLYLKKGTNIKSENYTKTKSIVTNFIEMIKKEL